MKWNEIKVGEQGKLCDEWEVKWSEVKGELAGWLAS